MMIWLTTRSTPAQYLLADLYVTTEIPVDTVPNPDSEKTHSMTKKIVIK